MAEVYEVHGQLYEFEISWKSSSNNDDTFRNFGFVKSESMQEAVSALEEQYSDRFIDGISLKRVERVFS